MAVDLTIDAWLKHEQSYRRDYGTFYRFIQFDLLSL